MVVVLNAKNNFSIVEKPKNLKKIWKIFKQEILGGANLHWYVDYIYEIAQKIF